MKKKKLMVLGMVAVISAASIASAQYPSFGRSGQPTVSPYIDLLQGRGALGRGAAFNYYRRIRPEMEFRQNERRLSQSISNLQREVDQSQIQLRQQKSTSYLGTTGHSTTFHNLGGYFSRPTSRR